MTSSLRCSCSSSRPIFIVRATNPCVGFQNLIIYFSILTLSFFSDKKGNRALIGVCAMNIVIYIGTYFFYQTINRRRDGTWNAMSPEVRGEDCNARHTHVCFPIGTSRVHRNHKRRWKQKARLPLCILAVAMTVACARDTSEPIYIIYIDSCVRINASIQKHPIMSDRAETRQDTKMTMRSNKEKCNKRGISSNGNGLLGCTPHLRRLPLLGP